MRGRHNIVEVTEPDEARCFELVVAMGPDPDDEVTLIDETVAPQPMLSPDLGGNADRPASRSGGSAILTSRPINQPRLNPLWGLGTDGWPRHNSRLVRLFACQPADFAFGVAGHEWGCLTLAAGMRPAEATPLVASAWPRLIDGTMQMPYRSRPLEIELQVQPFHDRYARVDVVLRSRHRWPRQYFDVASRCLTKMQRLERPLTLDH